MSEPTERADAAGQAGQALRQTPPRPLRQTPSRPLRQTPSQTVGPFFGFALPYAGGPELVPAAHPHAIRLHGTVLDGAGEGVPDGVVEIWQADQTGTVPTAEGSLLRDGHSFTGFGRAATRNDGHYSFATLKPGSVKGAAPYIFLTVFARGLSHHLFTRAYFPEDDALQRADALLSGLDPGRRRTLISVADAPASYRFDIRLQGEHETVFLDFDA